jgi:hypothetical protein
MNNHTFTRLHWNMVLFPEIKDFLICKKNLTEQHLSSKDLTEVHLMSIDK